MTDYRQSPTFVPAKASEPRRSWWLDAGREGFTDKAREEQRERSVGRAIYTRAIPDARRKKEGQ